MVEEHAPRISLDVIQSFALPSASLAELEQAMAHWNFINQAAIDLHRALMASDLTAIDIVVVELVTERASLQDVWDAFEEARLAPCGFVDAIRLIAATEPSRWQPFPFVCLGSISEATIPKAPVVDCASSRMIVMTEVSLYDHESQPDLGWSDHTFALARHFSSTPVH